MKAIVFSDIKSYVKNWQFVLLLIGMIAFGIFGGSIARFNLSDQLAYNSSYQIAFITAFLSLTTLFFSTFFTAQLSLKEFEYNFNLIYFSLPISPKKFLVSRVLSVYALSLFCTLLLTISFFTGREMGTNDELHVRFSAWYYLLPQLTFTVVNTFFVVAIASTVAWVSKSRLLVYVSGLLLYIGYMMAMIFSSSPFMANRLPQSKQAQWLSGILDPFGISAFFNQTSSLSVEQKNTELLPINGLLLSNRVGILIISLLLLLIASRKFAISKRVKNSKAELATETNNFSIPFQFKNTEASRKVSWLSFVSFVRIYSIGVIRSIPFVLLVIGLLFGVGMEIYAEIEKGIRIPQKYASSGLMLSTIIQNFHFLGALIIVFYGNDLYWRAKAANFHLIENTTTNSSIRLWSIGTVLVGIAFLFSSLLILEGICFQWLYKYNHLEWGVYAKVYLFNTLPMILVAGLTISVQLISKNRYVSLVISSLVVLLMTTSIGKSIIKYPLLKFLQGISFDYSDMNGFGTYQNAFINRLIFGGMVIALLLVLVRQTKKSIKRWRFWFLVLPLSILSIFFGVRLVSGYQPKNREDEFIEAVNYEKQFRKYQNLPQPTIVSVVSKVDLFPAECRYNITGTYVLENKSDQPIQDVVFNLPDDFRIIKAVFQCKGQKIIIDRKFQVVALDKPFQQNEKASFDFEIGYQWIPINGHQSFNSIIENGTFMRISRYYPLVGYQSGREVDDRNIRQTNGLGEVTQMKPLNAPKVANNDLINLELTISTEMDQTAIAIGDLKKEWKQDNRAYFQYKADSIPFRFAISSAKYQVEKLNYMGRQFEVYFHPQHSENVAYLLENAKNTVEYCEKNFSPYPFKTIRFAEISSFTRGFNATAYPATIFMKEDLAFHCNIKADKKQDVINELAGHEVAHFWWGNNQTINPDDRVGGVMLTETLAMYTELMLLKKMYGKKKAEETLAMHQQLFESEKGFNGDSPLILATPDMTHISYSKGAIVMYRLSELIGEGKVNEALRNFLTKNKYPNPKPISTDFLKELYNVTEVKFHTEIGGMFLK